jgi:ParB family chromosome partitioning protein
MTADEILEDQLIENCVREDLKPVEQARAFKALVERRGCSYRQLAEMLNISHMAVSRALSLLDLPEDVQHRVTTGELAASVAVEVAKLEDPEEQREVAERVVSEGLNRSEAIEAVRRASKSSSKGRWAIKARPKRPTVRAIKTTSARVTVEFKKAVEPAEIRAALVEALAKLDAEQGGEQAAA